MRDQGTRPGLDIGPDGLTDQQRAAGYAPRRHSVAYGERQQPGLATPLTEAELATGAGYGPAIADVGCTPRPRYGESQAKFLARMASYGADVEALKRDIRQRNRAEALRQLEKSDGSLVYWTQCACGWCGLRVDDPEVARREYDAHECAAEGVAQSAIDRAQAHAGKATMPAKRQASVLRPAMGPSPGDLERISRELTEAEAATGRLKASVTDERDDLEQRVALLEPKP